MRDVVRNGVRYEGKIVVENELHKAEIWITRGDVRWLMLTFECGTDEIANATLDDYFTNLTN